MPEDSLRAVVLALHGFTDYSHAFSGAAEYLVKTGIAVYAYDQRGFGGTEKRGIWPGTALLVDDLLEVVELVRQRHPEVPLFLLGESMGGAVVLVAMARRPLPDVDGVILVAPAVWDWRAMNPLQAGLLRLLAHVAPWLPASAIELRRLASDNAEMLDALERDPLVLQSVRIDAVYGLVTLMDEALESAPALDVPALALYGAHERIIASQARQAFLDRLHPAHEVRVYPSGYHTLLRDRQGPVVLEDMACWIRGGNVMALAHNPRKQAQIGPCGRVPTEGRTAP